MDISKFTLGTVQLGIPYGIANSQGKPDEKQAIEILEFAYESGINSFDTAPAYGDSEQRIGNFIQKLKDKKKIYPIAITKLSSIDYDKSEKEGIFRQIRHSVKSSLKNLNISTIPIFLLHKPEDMQKHDGAVVKCLLQLKKEGLIEKIGVSVYTSEEVEQFLQLGLFDAIQIPMNIFDLKLYHSGLLDELKRKNILVFVRSVFLQGLFFLNPKKLPAGLINAKYPLETLNKISEESGLGIAQIAIAFIRDLPGVSSLVLGVEKKTQLEENLELFNTPPLSAEIVNKIKKEFYKISEEITDPRLWNK
jgi:aryl-alcohol dehydrogenase-like predicted oxidoreductase